MDTSRILFLMALRNRRERAIASIQSIASSRFAHHFECVVIQDIAEDNLTRADVSNLSIPVTIVNQRIGGIFYKTKLLNMGFALTQNTYIVQQDADVIYTDAFLEQIVRICATPKNFAKYFFTTPYVESADMSEQAVNVWEPAIRKKGDFVGDTFLLYRPQVEAVNGFDEHMRMWHEEEDFGNRIMTHFKLAQYDLGVVGISNTHITHGNDLRSHTHEEALKNLNIFKDHRARGITVIPQKHVGGMIVAQYDRFICIHRNSEGDMTALKENLVNDVYGLASLDIQGMTVLDIGSHIGTFALQVSARAGRIVCYEPDTTSVLLLYKNMKLNNVRNVEVRPRALTVDGRDVVLHMHAGLSVLNSIVHNAYEHFVETVPSDAFSAAVQEIRPQLIKMDCEGGEYEMLYGADASLLRGVVYVCIEYHNMKHINETYCGEALIVHLQHIGFEVIRHEPDYDTQGGTGIVVLKNRV